METLRFVPVNDEEDLYSGFNDFPSALFNTKDLDQDEYVQMALRSSYSKRPGLVSYPVINGLLMIYVLIIIIT